MNFKNYEKNIQSQFGEDGIIEEIFKRIGTQNKVCVEFGAWDGIHFSNTWNLWHNNEWTAFLIENNKEKYETLVSNTKDFKKVRPYLTLVTPKGKNSLDSLLNKFDFPGNLDLLSIDIDGDDYYIFEGLLNYAPRLIIIEYNPTIPPGFDIIQKQGEYFGSSALSMLALGHVKGYKLAHVTDTNLFLVKEELFHLLGIDEPSLEDSFVKTHLSYIISGYDGKSFLLGNPPYFQLDTLSDKYIFPDLISKHENILKGVILNQELGHSSLIKRIIRKIKG